jgi:hypothetical protein
MQTTPRGNGLPMAGWTSAASSRPTSAAVLTRPAAMTVMTSLALAYFHSREYRPATALTIRYSKMTKGMARKKETRYSWGTAPSKRISSATAKHTKMLPASSGSRGR